VAQRIILADNQMIFRTGVARVLAVETDLQVVAQCADLSRLRDTLHRFRKSIVLFPSSFTEDICGLLSEIEAAGCQGVLVLEHGAAIDESVVEQVDGLVLRSVAGAQLVETLHRVAAGERVVQRESVKTVPSRDRVGTRVLERLTRKELQIIALVGEGFKNREIAMKLATKEQVVKNYLRTIYDKTGVSDRLELALFTIHHVTLSEAVERALVSLAKTA
jgi:DNA-binding NarL/FixJ family response regulator